MRKRSTRRQNMEKQRSFLVKKVTDYHEHVRYKMKRQRLAQGGTKGTDRNF